jgi:uncharacterized protein
MEGRISSNAGKGIIIAGRYGELLGREKAGERLELGELLICRDEQGRSMLLQVTDLQYGSQISQQNRELLSGLAMEDNIELTLQDSHLRTYTVATLKAIVTLPHLRAPKSLPSVFSTLHAVTARDINFERPSDALFLGNLRSGSKELPVPVHINGREALTHHLLIAATTGRGKSNLMKVLLQDLLDKDFASVLVFDPHAEYAEALSASSKRLAVYAKEPGAGQYSLRVNIGSLRPKHFMGVVEWSEAQLDALRLYYKRYGEDWVYHAMADEQPLQGVGEGTLMVLRRKLELLLSIQVDERTKQLESSGVFDTKAGSNTIEDVAARLLSGSVVVVETAALSDQAEILLATLLTNEVYERWKASRPRRILSICLEEAPRFIGDDALRRGPNVFSQIAREGRKFNVGLVAITQMPSLIPRQVLANINTKVILGIEMSQERSAIIDSAPQDLSSDSRVIASLEKGEAIVTSVFTAFAVPVRIPLHVKRPSPPPLSVPGLKR